MTTIFRPGMHVFFDGPKGRVQGTIIRVNKKTISIDPGTGDGYFRVPHANVHASGEDSAAATWEPDREDMMLAFALQGVCKIIEADGVVHPAEIDFMHAALPVDEFERRGLFADGEPTEKFQLALRESVKSLPGTLDHNEKLRLTDLFVRACFADGELDPREGEVVKRAVALVGVPQEEFNGLVRELHSRQEAAQPGLARGREYPVISVSLDAVEEALAEKGRPFSFNEQGLAALVAINTRKRKPAELSIWAREGTGYDRANRPAQLVFFYVVAQRGSGDLSVRFQKELNLLWADQCRMEGNYEPVGGERRLWDLDADGAREFE